MHKLDLKHFLMRIRQYLSVLLASSFFLTSCKKENSEPSKYPFYFVGKINGRQIRYEANDSTTAYKCQNSSNSFGIPPNVEQYEGTFFWNPGDAYRNQIIVQILKRFSHTPDLTERKGIWKAGNVKYGVGSLGGVTANVIEGVTIRYLDENLIVWTSEAGSQNGSTFTVTELWSSNEGTVFRAIFSCTLFDSNGNPMKLENCEMRGRLF